MLGVNEASTVEQSEHHRRMPSQKGLLTLFRPGRCRGPSSRVPESAVANLAWNLPKIPDKMKETRFRGY